ncbi:oligoribonuclease [bacterium]|nr:oligoribonuclease [bacterium]
MNNSNLLVWMDLEMTGLIPAEDKILEIATVITDIALNVVEQGPELVIHQADKVLGDMNDWCQEHHGKSGLTERVRVSQINEFEAEERTLEFLKQHINPGEVPLCGNSIHQDRNFLAQYMPRLHEFLHYRNIDVSSVKELTYRWYPELPKFKKSNTHTALQDILESIEELKYYKEKIFRDTIL